jgi:hypothetical protein
VLVGGRVAVHFQPRKAGLNAFHLRFTSRTARRVTVEAWDEVGNRMTPRIVALPR